MQGMGYQKMFLLGLVWLAMPLSLLAQSLDSSSSFQIAKSGAVIKISVLRSSSLQEVLSRLCSGVPAKCSGLELTAQLSVSSSQIAGKWEEVIAKLLEGTRLNFVTQTAPSGGIPTLLIQGPYAKDEPAASRMSAAPAPDNQQVDQVADAAVASNPAVQNSADVPSKAESSVLNTGTSAPRGTVASFAPIQSLDSGAVLPFPDAGGKMLPATEVQADYLPFPDNGKIMPVGHAGPEYLPFPDNGKIIPAKPPEGGSPLPPPHN
jgi:hypothetical protein